MGSPPAAPIPAIGYFGSDGVYELFSTSGVLALRRRMKKNIPKAIKAIPTTGPTTAPAIHAFEDDPDVDFDTGADEEPWPAAPTEVELEVGFDEAVPAVGVIEVSLWLSLAEGVAVCCGTVTVPSFVVVTALGVAVADVDSQEFMVLVTVATSVAFVFVTSTTEVDHSVLVVVDNKSPPLLFNRAPLSIDL